MVHYTGPTGLSPYTDFHGIIPPLATPFDEEENINIAALKREARFLVNAGVNGVAFGGSTSEGATLTDDEIAIGIRALKEEVAVPILAGIIRNSTRDATRTAGAAKEAGADALMVTPTYYHGSDSAGNYGFFRKLAKAAGLPIIIYNVIATNPIKPAAVKQLALEKHVAGVKQSVGGIHGLADMIHECGEHTLVFGAQDDVLHLSYALGAVGAISAILTLCPELCVKQWKAVAEGNLAAAREINERILPVWRKIEGRAFPARIKAALNLMGRPVGRAREPISPVSTEETNELSESLRHAGLI